MSAPQPKTYAGVSQLIDGIAGDIERRSMPIALSLLRDARAHLSMAVMQSHPEDDQPNAEHTRQALLLTDMAIKFSESRS